MFSEIAFYAGIAASDWSWASLWMDFDNDGQKDLFISNGIPRRLNDIDYVNYISNDVMQARIRSDEMDKKDFEFLDKFPQIKLRNKFFRHTEGIRFADDEVLIGNNRETFSNGAAYADFDNDGDLDIVVNNIDESAYIYRNNTDNSSYIKVSVRGDSGNTNAIGARIIFYSGDQRRVVEKMPVRGFQSSMELPLLLGTGGLSPDSILLVWPDGRYQKLDTGKTSLVVRYHKDLPVFKGVEKAASVGRLFADITEQSGLDYVHKENDYVEFNREPLLPFMLSMEGPALAVGDMNNDGLDEVFIGGARKAKSALFVQESPGKFRRRFDDVLGRDSLFEDVDAVWEDINRDGFKDLMVASGGNEYYGADSLMSPRIYLNDGGKRFIRLPLIRGVAFTSSSIVPFDFNGDGLPDLFIGSRTKAFAYGILPDSYIMINDGRGGFSDGTDAIAPGLRKGGMVKDAEMADLDGDGDADLVLALEWGNVVALMNDKGKFVLKSLTDVRAWWNFVKPIDIDHDGDLDIVVGNHGENARIRPSAKEPVHMYYDDFDGNQLSEQVVSYYLQGQEIPFAGKADLEKQMPGIKKKFLYAEDFARADMGNIIDRTRLNAATVYAAESFANVLLINEGNMKFTMRVLPVEAQYTCYRDALVFDCNGDGWEDLLLGGNYFGDAISMGRNDADLGTVLLNKGGGKLEVIHTNGITIRNQVRRISKLKLGGNREGYVLARNDDAAMLLELRPAVNKPAGKSSSLQTANR
jgi:hypothetical protein